MSSDSSSERGRTTVDLLDHEEEGVSHLVKIKEKITQFSLSSSANKSNVQNSTNNNENNNIIHDNDCLIISVTGVDEDYVRSLCSKLGLYVSSALHRLDEVLDDQSMIQPYYNQEKELRISKSPQIMELGPFYSPMNTSTNNFSLDPLFSSTLQDLYLKMGHHPSDKLNIIRENALRKLSNEVEQWVKDVANVQNLIPSSVKNKDDNNDNDDHENHLPQGGIVCVSGSYTLGVADDFSDVDAVCVVPKQVSKNEFFSSFVNRLQKNKDITQCYPIPEAMVPVISIVIDGVSIDLLYSCISQTSSVPKSLDVLDDSLLVGMSSQCVMSISGPRNALTIRKIVGANYHNFSFALGIIRFWANQRGLYSSKLGLLGGLSWAILVAMIVQLLPPKSEPAVIVYYFMKIFSKWNWKSNPVRLCAASLNWSNTISSTPSSPRAHHQSKLHQQPLYHQQMINNNFITTNNNNNNSNSNNNNVESVRTEIALSKDDEEDITAGLENIIINTNNNNNNNNGNNSNNNNLANIYPSGGADSVSLFSGGSNSIGDDFWLEASNIQDGFQGKALSSLSAGANSTKWNYRGTNNNISAFENTKNHHSQRFTNTGIANTTFGSGLIINNRSDANGGSGGGGAGSFIDNTNNQNNFSSNSSVNGISAGASYTMPIITPSYPPINAAASLTKSGFFAVQEELQRGCFLLERAIFGLKSTPRTNENEAVRARDIKFAIMELFEPYDIFAYYENFFRVFVFAENSESWARAYAFTLSRLRRFVTLIEDLTFVGNVRLLPTCFPCTTAEGETSGNFHGYFLIGFTRLNSGFDVAQEKMNDQIMEIERMVKFFQATSLDASLKKKLKIDTITVAIVVSLPFHIPLNNVLFSASMVNVTPTKQLPVATYGIAAKNEVFKLSKEVNRVMMSELVSRIQRVEIRSVQGRLPTHLFPRIPQGSAGSYSPSYFGPIGANSTNRDLFSVGKNNGVVGVPNAMGNYGIMYPPFAAPQSQLQGGVAGYPSWNNAYPSSNANTSPVGPHSQQQQRSIGTSTNQQSGGGIYTNSKHHSDLSNKTYSNFAQHANHQQQTGVGYPSANGIENSSPFNGNSNNWGQTAVLPTTSNVVGGGNHNVSGAFNNNNATTGVVQRRRHHSSGTDLISSTNPAYLHTNQYVESRSNNVAEMGSDVQQNNTSKLKSTTGSTKQSAKSKKNSAKNLAIAAATTSSPPPETTSPTPSTLSSSSNNIPIVTITTTILEQSLPVEGNSGMKNLLIANSKVDIKESKIEEESSVVEKKEKETVSVAAADDVSSTSSLSVEPAISAEVTTNPVVSENVVVVPTKVTGTAAAKYSKNEKHGSTATTTVAVEDDVSLFSDSDFPALR